MGGSGDADQSLRANEPAVSFVDSPKNCIASPSRVLIRDSMMANQARRKEQERKAEIPQPGTFDPLEEFQLLKRHGERSKAEFRLRPKTEDGEPLPRASGWIRSAKLSEFWRSYKSEVVTEELLTSLRSSWSGSDEDFEVLVDSGTAFRAFDKVLKAPALSVEDYQRLHELGFETVAVWLPAGSSSDGYRSLFVPEQDLYSALSELGNPHPGLVTALATWRKIDQASSAALEITKAALGQRTLDDEDQWVISKTLDEALFAAIEHLEQTISINSRIINLENTGENDYRIVYNSEMDRNNTELLKQVFAIISKLPAGELERLVSSSQKKLDKWAGVPSVAPELYRDRRASEDLPSFLRRVYAAAGHLDGRLTRVHLDVLDPPLGMAIREWVSRHGSLPEDINLPAKIPAPRPPTRSGKPKSYL